MHSDGAHDEYAAGTYVPETTEMAIEIIDQMKGCWVCHPELNLAQKPYTPRKASQATGTRNQGVRRPQLNHKAQCLHPQTPEARKACKNRYWAELAKAEADATKAHEQFSK